MAAIHVQPLSYGIGAEVTGVDLAGPIAPEQLAQIHQAWLDHCILCFPGQAITPQQQVAFSRLFGEVDRNETTPTYQLPGLPEVIEVTNRPKDGKPSPSREVGRTWHSDLEHTLRPLKASLLWCGELPGVGGDTMFANLYLAYESLSEAMKKLVEPLEVVHDIASGFGGRSQDLWMLGEVVTSATAHPLVRVHPETGRKALFVSARASRIVGFKPEEGEPILAYLRDLAGRPEFVYRHRWRINDLVMWDNRCTNHLALADYDRSRVRYMRRTSVVGEPLGRVVEG